MTRVEITTPIEKLRLHAPASVIEMLKATHYYASSSDSIVIRSDVYRKQGENREDCFKRLYDLYLEVGEDAVKKERSKGPLKKSSVMIKTPIDALYSFFSFSVRRSLTIVTPAKLDNVSLT